MKLKHFMSSLALVVLAMTALSVNAGNIDANAAHRLAGQFIQQQASKGSFKAHAATDIKLIHAEASSAMAGACDYYAFNLTGGGFVIIAGEDRAPQVLGYSDKGRLDFNNLPYNVKGLLDSYKREIEFLQTYKGDDLVPVNKNLTATAGGVDPLIKTTWGQEDPYDWQCPVYQGQYCAVGCVATAMAQVMKYWQYPEGSSSLSSYYCNKIRQTVSALPATTFDYSLLLNSYCHWDYDNSQLVQDTYTDAQAQEVAKLSRYCGQAVQMSYHPDGSGAYTSDQRNAMVSFGYRSSAKYVQKSSSSGWGWGSSGYTTAEWEALMKTELDAGRPILFAASDTGGDGGHAFICDGYSSDGTFHFNFGWYGTCDGWYVSTALNMTHRSGDYLRYNTGQEMVIGIEPPEGWEPPVTFLLGDVNGDGAVNIADVTKLIDYLLDDTTAINLDAADVKGDGVVNIADVTALIDLLLDNSAE